MCIKEELRREGSGSPIPSNLVYIDTWRIQLVSSTATDRSQESLHTKHRLVVQRERHINTTNCIHS
jgi:hypothetical protein